ncbi:sirohydrochlorin chelatase [Imhoffiella purpurea]|uniref:Cobalamin biosynthesis protein CbiX n=1 Tax=Imhoffiella purpurea TaxID=1249627 RepID=W9VEB1_9GAMM|nr:CbiX/SirB N-terminal domain-containing protein [Imhoffiella purpurea]EXJ14367.1 hypothetical protein D779_2700 [Imhoffiella purpurea]
MGAILLVDNGSRRAESTLNLRRIASALSERLDKAVLPVSLLHSNQVDPGLLDGRPAETFADAVGRLLADDRRELILLPLFFGPTRAISQFIPDTLSELVRIHGPCRLRTAPVLCPLPGGEPRLVDILADNVDRAASSADSKPSRVVLVDHGSPIPGVTQVRRWLGERLAQRLAPGIRLYEAVMERRPGSEYDFNGELLETLLDRLAEQDTSPIALAMLFMGPGRHAGPGGDISDICRRVETRHPGLQLYPSPLVGTHPGLIDILVSRLRQAETLPAIGY